MLKGFIAALNAKYMMQPRYAEHLAAIAYLVMEKKITFDKDTFDLSAKAPYILEKTSALTSKVIGKVSVINMEGPLFRNRMLCGPMGMIETAEKLQEYDRDSEIDAHVIKMHTPGGEVSGLETLADVVAGTQKPVVIFGEDIFSAGVYIAAGASSIVLSGKNAAMGSIGVQVNYRSYKKRFEQAGIEEITIKANTSPDKNSYNLDNPSAEDKARFATEILDPLDQHFMDHVRQHRSGVAEEALTGKEYYAEQAIALGLADQIGTFESAVELALSLAGKTASSTRISMFNKKKKADPETKEETNPEVEATTDQTVESDLQVQLQAKDSRITALEAMVSAKDKIIAIHLQTIADNQQVIELLRKENERLAQLPASDPEAEVTTTTEDISTKMEDDKPQGPPLPPEIQAAIEAGQRRRARHVKNGTLKTAE